MKTPIKNIIILMVLIFIFTSCTNAQKTNNDDISKTIENSASIAEVNIFDKNLDINFNNYLPPKEVINMGGNGLQLFNSNGDFIKSDTSLDCTNKSDLFLRIIWLDKIESNVSIIILADNVVQDFSVDNQKMCSVFNLQVKPQSAVNVPISFNVSGVKNKNCNINFLMFYNDPKLNGFDDENTLQNSVNNLSYKATINATEEPTPLKALTYLEQNNNNDDFSNSGSLYSVITSDNSDNFMFFNQETNISLEKEANLYLMGTGKGTTFFLLNDKLIAPFDKKQYLQYTLTNDKYLKQKLSFDFSKVSDGDILKMIHIQETDGTKAYKITSHKLSVTK